MSILTLLLAALLFGGMTLFSFGFAAALFAVFGPDEARKGLRGTFPHYYLWVIVLSIGAGAAAFATNAFAAWLLLGIALSTVYARQVLMPQINAATDMGDKRRFGLLHGVSVVIQIIQIGVAGWAVVLLGT